MWGYFLAFLKKSHKIFKKRQKPIFSVQKMDFLGHLYIYRKYTLIFRKLLENECEVTFWLFSKRATEYSKNAKKPKNDAPKVAFLKHLFSYRRPIVHRWKALVKWIGCYILAFPKILKSVKNRNWPLKGVFVQHKIGLSQMPLKRRNIYYLCMMFNGIFKFS